MKRFYKQAEAGTAPGGYIVRLDGKNIKTPLHHPFILTSEPLAKAIAEEWQAQGDDVIPASMPLTQLANVMIDKANGHERPVMTEDLVRFAGSDLVCYFGTHPSGLVERQEAQWMPLLDWLRNDKGIALKSVSGIQYHHQDKAALAAIKKWVDGLNAADFTVVQAVTGATGSIVIALALLEKRISAEQAYQASVVDEIYQLEKWGADDLAQKKLDALLIDLKQAEEFRDLVQAV